MKAAILFVILQTDALANGGLQSIGEVMRRLKHHRPIVLTNRESAFTQSWRQAGIEVTVVPEQASGGFRRDPVGTLRTYARYRRAVRRLLAGSGARVVHANEPLAFQLAVAAAKQSGARIILNLRDTVDPARRPPTAKFRLIFGAADHVLYLSHDMAERWRAVAGNAQRAFSVTYSIVDAARFGPSPMSAVEPPVVLVPGIFWPKKGQLDFIRNVVPKLAVRGIRTWFAGDFEPAANGYAADCAAAAGPFSDWITFLGYRTDLPELFQQASAVAVPSRHEGLMRGMIEAMACGCPVVSFDVCSAREVLEEESGAAGAVVPHGDHDAMAEALIRYATDAAARSAAGRAGIAAARELFDPDRVVERYESVYRRLAEA